MAVTTKRTRAKVAAALSTMPDEYLLCRDPAYKHRMNIVNDMHLHEGRGKYADVVMYARDNECERCGTKRKDVFLCYTDDTVEKIRSSYQYPKDYMILGVVQGIKPSVLIYTEMMERVKARQASRKRAA